jgi:hypothetical protein
VGPTALVSENNAKQRLVVFGLRLASRCRVGGAAIWPAQNDGSRHTPYARRLPFIPGVPPVRIAKNLSTGQIGPRIRPLYAPLTHRLLFDEAYGMAEGRVAPVCLRHVIVAARRVGIIGSYRRYIGAIFRYPGAGIELPPIRDPSCQRWDRRGCAPAQSRCIVEAEPDQCVSLPVLSS